MISKRNRTADLLKGVAVILMIQVHIIELFAQQQIFDSYLGSILLFLGGPPAAPVFMAVMGYFIAKGNSNISKSVIRGLKLIGGGLLLNLGLNFHLLVKIYNQDIVISPWPYLFGVDILFLAGLSIIIIAILKKITKKNPIICIIIIALIFVIQQLPYPTSLGTMSYINAFFHGNVWWSYFPIIPWLAYPVIGYLFYLMEPKLSVYIEKQLFKTIMIITTGVILIFSVSYGIKIAANLHVYYLHDFVFYLFCLNFIIFWTLLLKIITSFSSNFISTFIEWVGKKVTVIYVIQWLIIGNIATGLYKTQNGIQLLLWFFVIVISTSLLTFLYTKIKVILKPNVN
ncbi:MAG: heparan-alpha-glucosaminide N-acetyltransferase domain-containing protein [Bacteroidota bacterium]